MFISINTMLLWILKKTPAWLVSWYLKIYRKKNLPVFEKLLELPKWKKVSFGPNEKWIFEDDNSFTIEIADNTRDFKECWTDKFLDKKSFATDIFLKIGGELVDRSLLFIYVDGGRNLVPCPKQAEAYDRRYFYWDRDSLEYKVFGSIGFLDNYYDNNLELFGKRCGVEIK